MQSNRQKVNGPWGCPKYQFRSALKNTLPSVGGAAKACLPLSIPPWPFLRKPIVMSATLRLLSKKLNIKGKWSPHDLKQYFARGLSTSLLLLGRYPQLSTFLVFGPWVILERMRNQCCSYLQTSFESCHQQYPAPRIAASSSATLFLHPTPRWASSWNWFGRFWGLFLWFHQNNHHLLHHYLNLHGLGIQNSGGISWVGRHILLCHLSWILVDAW